MHPRTNVYLKKIVLQMGRLAVSLALVLTLCSPIAAAQPRHRVQSPEKLQAAFNSLKATPNSRTAQHRYLKAFPRT
ncbi:MAG TPA: hypothetical protein VLA83_00060, partial [Candidatus Binatia bacterium]|nr:hypothetical protein [Candidatus Binatia bacterium]